MDKDTDPILQVLSHYLQHLTLNGDELEILRSWHRESEANENLFDDVSNEAKWKDDCPENISQDLAGSLERIRMRLAENSKL